MLLHGGPRGNHLGHVQGDWDRRGYHVVPLQVSPGPTEAAQVRCIIVLKREESSFFFAIGLLAIPWLLPSEYAPLPIRAPAAALASASNWIVSTCSEFQFPHTSPMV
jgi:hypothetical protein